MTATAKAIVIGAGIGGLAAAIRLRAAGLSVTVYEASAAPGGKIRAVPTAAGPCDAGPTVLTMRPVFDALFAAAGTRLDAHVTLRPLPVLARHFWSDGTRFDLFADPDATHDEIGRVFGQGAAQEHARFCKRAATLFDGFDGPMMQNANPSLGALIRQVALDPGLLRAMAPFQSLSGLLRRSFSDPRLRQLYGRYATYVGGSPSDSPALLALISQAEARGVWAVQGGLTALTEALASVATGQGVRFRYNTPVRRIIRQGGRAVGVEGDTGSDAADLVVFNGDPRALSSGAMGSGLRQLIPTRATEPRSLSAVVLAFAAAPTGADLSHHNVFFADTSAAEFNDIAMGRLPNDAALYLCAQDAGTVTKGDLQRFEVILNAPAGLKLTQTEKQQCLHRMMDRFATFGLRFHPPPQLRDMTTPAEFAVMFPGSQGALYGRSPRGMTAALRRPTARTALPGLYLCGGGTHPGAGVPMAALSGRHAAEAIMTDLALTSTSHPADMHGGTSMDAALVAAKQSLS